MRTAKDIIQSLTRDELVTLAAAFADTDHTHALRIMGMMGDNPTTEKYADALVELLLQDNNL